MRRVEGEGLITIRRPFHWGVVFVMAEESKGDIPEPVPEQVVTANDAGIAILVRPAQDTDEVEGDRIKFAEVEIGIRLRDATAESDAHRREVFRGSINLPSGRLNVGDADDETTVMAHRGRNTIVVSVNKDSPPEDVSPDVVWVDLIGEGD